MIFVADGVFFCGFVFFLVPFIYVASKQIYGKCLTYKLSARIYKYIADEFSFSVHAKVKDDRRVEM